MYRRVYFEALDLLAQIIQDDTDDKKVCSYAPINCMPHYPPYGSSKLKSPTLGGSFVVKSPPLKWVLTSGKVGISPMRLLSIDPYSEITEVFLFNEAGLENSSHQLRKR